ncbi:hypothetical protein U6G28_08900 [Actinomycetaceae bacterium MB13-C1-2]|nr:hypothetical protein U6G28_08900 [Actinomycetaceae bacterium MB13-C1-2]
MLSDQEMRALADKATEGPWAAWLDQDGTPHMQGRLMVGNSEGVIPEGETFIDGVEINPVAECYTPEDRQFIAAAREWVPDALTRFAAIRELHQPDWSDWDIDHPEEEANCTCGYNGSYSECPTVRILDRSES